LMMRLGVSDHLAGVISILIVFFVRVMAVQLNWSLPKFYDKKPVSRHKEES
jgi:uncharacterized membrane protein YeiH